MAAVPLLCNKVEGNTAARRHRTSEPRISEVRLPRIFRDKILSFAHGQNCHYNHELYKHDTFISKMDTVLERDLDVACTEASCQW